jgi:hypothetical protein
MNEELVKPEAAWDFSTPNGLSVLKRTVKMQSRASNRFL